MDAGGLGALIGVSFMAGICIVTYLYDLYNKRKEKPKLILPEILIVHPIVTEENPILMKKASHKKLNEFLPEVSVPSP
jgi:hypothetical protein